MTSSSTALNARKVEFWKESAKYQRFITLDTPKHFKLMSWAHKTLAGSASRNKREMYRIFKRLGHHYVAVENSKRRVAQVEKVQVGDCVHMYHGKAGHDSLHFRGKTASTYQRCSEEEKLHFTSLPEIMDVVPAEVFVGAILFKCKIDFDDTEILTSEWRTILTQHGCGTVIPLKM